MAKLCTYKAGLIVCSLILLPVFRVSGWSELSIKSVIESDPSAVAFVNVNVIPMDRDHILSNQTVTIERGIITQIGPANKIKVPGGAFDDVAPGRGYTIAVASRRYRFAPKTVSIGGDVADLDFTAQE